MAVRYLLPVTEGRLFCDSRKIDYLCKQNMSEAMNIYETFNNLRYHHENEVVEFKKAENSFDFDDLGKYFSALSNIKMYVIWIER